MSALSELQHHLTRYWALPYHQDPTLNDTLNEVQTWQRARIQRTHQALFEQPKNQPMARYFLTQLYGGDEFKVLAKQLERILPKAKKLERLAKESALETGTMAIQAAILAIELDMHLAQWLLAQNLPVNEANILAAYRGSDESAERYAQINHLKEVCYRTDKYLNSFVLRKAFDFSKGAAYRHHYQPLYDFIDAGFHAMKPLKSVGSFIDSFCVRETKLIEQIHAADNDGNLSAFTVS